MNDTELVNDTVQFVNIASLFAKRALDELSAFRAGQTKASSSRAETLKYLVDNGVIRAADKQGADAMLGSHAETMQLLRNAVERLVQKNAEVQELRQRQGLGEAQKSANHGNGYDSLKDPYLGRRTSKLKESDRRLLAVLDDPI